MIAHGDHDRIVYVEIVWWYFILNINNSENHDIGWKIMTCTLLQKHIHDSVLDVKRHCCWTTWQPTVEHKNLSAVLRFLYWFTQVLHTGSVQPVTFSSREDASLHAKFNTSGTCKSLHGNITSPHTIDREMSQVPILTREMSQVPTLLRHTPSSPSVGHKLFQVHTAKCPRSTQDGLEVCVWKLPATRIY